MSPENDRSLISELRSLAATNYPLCQEARILLELAVEAQLGNPIDLSKLPPKGMDDFNCGRQAGSEGGP